jgi:hypothetical protein
MTRMMMLSNDDITETYRDEGVKSAYASSCSGAFFLAGQFLVFIRAYRAFSAYYARFFIFTQWAFSSIFEHFRAFSG